MIPNPVPEATEGVPSDWFVGRRELLQEVAPPAAAGAVVVVSGLRGQGKTSLVQRLAQSAISDSTLVLSYEWREPTASRTVLVREFWDQAVKSGQMPIKTKVAAWGKSNVLGVSTFSGSLLTGATIAAALASPVAAVLFAIGGAAPLPMLFMRGAPTDATDFRNRLSELLRPAISRVVILIDEAHFGLKQTRDLAKSLEGLTGSSGRSYHVIVSCLEEMSSQVSTSKEGPRYPVNRSLEDFGLLEVRTVVDKVVAASQKSTTASECDLIAKRVRLETGGIPDVTIGFLHEVWSQWTTGCTQKRPIGLQDVYSAANSATGLHQRRLGRILDGVSQPKPDDSNWRDHFSRMLTRLAKNESLDDALKLQDLKAVLKKMTHSGDEAAAPVDGLITELLAKNVLRKKDDVVQFRGRLLRRGMGAIGPARG